MRGIGRYVFEFIARLHRDHPEVELLVSLNASMYDELLIARKILAPIVPRENIFAWESVCDRGEGVDGYSDARRLSERMLAHHVATLAPDLALSASPMEGGQDACVPLMDNHGHDYPVVALFYDAIPLRFPDVYLFDQNTHNYYNRRLGAYRNVDHILTISEFSLSEAEDLFPGVPATNMDAAVSQDMMQLIRTAQAKRISDRQQTETGARTVLYVGGSDWRKNVSFISASIAELSEPLRSQTIFRLVGSHPASERDALTSHWLSLELPPENLIHSGFTSDADLVEAYYDCACLIQPSRMEGFGLTALEAMHCGVPVLGTDAGALPEVIGNPDVLFDPDDPSSLADLIQAVLLNDRFNQVCRKRAKARASAYNWSYSVDIALGAMKPMARNTTQKPFDTLREITRKELICPPDITRKQLASRLAANEVSEAEDAKVFLEITSTAQTDHGTGIQRVVRQVTENMLRGSETDSDRFPLATVPVQCTTRKGFYPARLPERGRRGGATAHDVVISSSRDSLVLLDSSWTHIDAQSVAVQSMQARGTRIYSVLYDMIPLRYPGVCAYGVPAVFADWMEKVLRFADGFICISESVAREFETFLKTIDFPHPMKIGWWPLGADFDDMPNSHAISGDPNSYLVVATVEPRKGHVTVLEAFERLWKDGHDVKLTLLGRTGWTMERFEARIANHPELGRRLFRLKDADDIALKQAYATHKTLIAASISEGYGLPLIEAARYGCDVVASDIAVFKEVAPVGTRFFDVGDAAALAHLISTTKPDAPTDRVAAPHISWAQSAQNLNTLIAQDNFQILYTPTQTGFFRPRADIGERRMVDEHPLQDFNIEIDMPFGDQPDRILTWWLYRLRIVNRSDETLYGLGDETGRLGVNASFTAMDENGDDMTLPAHRTAIPYALGPGEDTIIGVIIDRNIGTFGAKQVRFGLLQEGWGWWPQTVTIDLPPVPTDI